MWKNGREQIKCLVEKQAGSRVQESAKYVNIIPFYKSSLQRVFVSWFENLFGLGIMILHCCAPSS